MSDEATEAQAAAGEGATAGANVGDWPAAEPGQAGESAAAGQHPELAVAAAFGGGLLAAILLRRRASRD